MVEESEADREGEWGTRELDDDGEQGHGCNAEG